MRTTVKILLGVTSSCEKFTPLVSSEKLSKGGDAIRNNLAGKHSLNLLNEHNILEQCLTILKYSKSTSFVS